LHNPLLKKIGRMIRIIKIFLPVCFVIQFTILNAQKGDELLVYSVEGNITAIYQGQESPVKIGKVLKPGTILNVQKESMLTMVCKQGKPLFITKEGVYPVNNWKDSCKSGNRSLTSRYFSYVWSELYYRSQDYKEDIDKYGSVSLVRGEFPSLMENYPDDSVFVLFNTSLDTLNFSEGNFPLCWQPFGYDGKVQFRIYTAKTRKLVFKDSIAGSRIFMDKFLHKMKPGTNYAWTILLPVKTGVIRRRIINYIPVNAVNQLVDSLKKTEIIAEDSAAKYFRTGFVLEKKHFLYEANKFYKKAVEWAPEMSVYSDKLKSFIFEFRLEDMKLFSDSQKKQVKTISKEIRN